MIAEITSDLGKASLGLDVDRRDDHGDDGQPGERRYRLEELDQRVDGAVERRRQTAGNASGTAISVAMRKPRPTVFSEVTIWSKIGRLAGVVAPLDLFGFAGGDKLGVARRPGVRRTPLPCRARRCGRPTGSTACSQTWPGPGMAPERGMRPAERVRPRPTMKMAMPMSGMNSTRFSSPSCSRGLSPAAILNSGVSQPKPRASSHAAALLMRAKRRSRRRMRRARRWRSCRTRWSCSMSWSNAIVIRGDRLAGGRRAGSRSSARRPRCLRASAGPSAR